MKTILLTTTFALISTTAWANPNQACSQGNAAWCNQVSEDITRLEQRIEDVNDEDQRLVDGRIDQNDGRILLYTQDMVPGRDGDISRREVVVDGLAEYTDYKLGEAVEEAGEQAAAGDRKVLKEVIKRDKRLEYNLKRYSDQNDQRIMTWANDKFTVLDGQMKAFDSRLSNIENQVDENTDGIAGVAALSSIDFVENRPQIGFGVSSWDGVTGWAVKGMAPINDDVHGSVGAFGANGKAGVAGSVVFKF